MTWLGGGGFPAYLGRSVRLCALRWQGALHPATGGVTGQKSAEAIVPETRIGGLKQAWSVIKGQAPSHHQFDGRGMRTLFRLRLGRRHRETLRPTEKKGGGIQHCRRLRGPSRRSPRPDGITRAPPPPRRRPGLPCRAAANHRFRPRTGSPNSTPVKLATQVLALRGRGRKNTLCACPPIRPYPQSIFINIIEQRQFADELSSKQPEGRKCHCLTHAYSPPG